jgi:hypothetical protein
MKIEDNDEDRLVAVETKRKRGGGVAEVRAVAVKDSFAAAFPTARMASTLPLFAYWKRVHAGRDASNIDAERRAACTTLGTCWFIYESP